MANFDKAQELLQAFKGDSYLHGIGILSQVGRVVASLGARPALVRDTFPGSDAFVLFSCTTGPAEDCLVELNGPALQNLIATSDVTVSPGTYDEVAVGYCSGASQTQWDAFMTAEARFDGATYYSRTGLGLDDAGPQLPSGAQFGDG